MGQRYRLFSVEERFATAQLRALAAHAEDMRHVPGSLHFGKVDMELAYRKGLELARVGLVALHIQRPRDAMRTIKSGIKHAKASSA